MPSAHTAHGFEATDDRLLIRRDPSHVAGALAVQREPFPLRRPRLEATIQIVQIAVCPRDRSVLHERIAQRFGQMMEQGLLQETEALLRRDPKPGRTARQGLGYREILQHLEHGVPLDACVQQIKIGTRQFAKRQRTWFRNLEECTSVVRLPDETEAELAERLLDRFNKP